MLTVKVLGSGCPNCQRVEQTAKAAAKELGLEATFPGLSLFSVQEDEPRERIYRGFVGPQEDVDYLAPLYEYAVTGFAWDDESWSETGKVYYAKQGGE